VRIESDIEQFAENDLYRWRGWHTLWLGCRDNGPKPINRSETGGAF
jgi:hypothetical protein